VSKVLEFHIGPGPKARSIKMDKWNRQWIDWFEPLNEIFGIAEMSFDDITKKSQHFDAQCLHDLVAGAKWDDCQNTYLKALAHFLLAIPLHNKGCSTPTFRAYF
jgi:hypothetical protein